MTTRSCTACRKSLIALAAVSYEPRKRRANRCSSRSVILSEPRAGFARASRRPPIPEGCSGCSPSSPPVRSFRWEMGMKTNSRLCFKYRSSRGLGEVRCSQVQGLQAIGDCPSSNGTTILLLARHPRQHQKSHRRQRSKVRQSSFSAHFLFELGNSSYDGDNARILRRVLDDSFSAWISESHRDTCAGRGACAGHFHMPGDPLSWHEAGHCNRTRQQRWLACCWIPSDRLHPR